MIIRILDFNQKISDHVTDLFKSLFQLLQKNKIIVRRNSNRVSYTKKAKKKTKERNSDFSGEKPNTKVQGRKSEQCQKHYTDLLTKTEFGKSNDVALKQTLDFVSVNIFDNLTVETAEPTTKWLNRNQSFCGDCSF